MVIGSDFGDYIKPRTFQHKNDSNYNCSPTKSNHLFYFQIMRYHLAIYSNWFNYGLLDIFFLFWPNSGEACLWDQFGCLLSLCNQPQWPPKAAASKSQPDACRRCSATEFISSLCASLLSYLLSVCNNKPFAHKVKKTLTECLTSAHQAKLFKHLQWEQFA